MALVDLHLHTTASDGRLSPRKLVELVASRGIKVMAITDHDSTEGLAEALEAAQAFPDLTIIPGIELSTDIPGNEIHLLGYFIEYGDASFQSTLVRFRMAREERAIRMVEKLANLGIQIEWARVKALAGDGAIGRPHIAQAMVEKGYITLPNEAFAKYIGRNGPAYAEREKLTPVEAVQLIKKVHGLPVLAHPSYVEDLDKAVSELKDAGLVGMEVYYGNYSKDMVQALESLASKHHIIRCGGSDYHAVGTPGETQPGSVGPPLEVAHHLIALGKERH